MRGRLSFVFALLFEMALLAAALGWVSIFGEPVLGSVIWSFTAAVHGTVAALPLLIAFAGTLKSELPVFKRHRDLLDSLIPGVFGGWPVWQLAVISLCAGVCEEALFRGAIQASLTPRIGSGAAVVAVALLFGALHLLSWTYGLIAAVLGAYLGLLYLWSGNLLIPMVAHGVYDFLALLYFLRIRRKPE